MNRLFIATLVALSTGCGGTSTAADGGSDHAGGHAHGAAPTETRPEIAPVVDVQLDPKGGAAIGLIYESYLSPQQEADEESDVPDAAPAVFKSSKTPAVPREQRPGRGHGIVAFTKDFSRAYAQLALTDIDPDEIVMVHLHCGRPGQLGPIIVDFGKTGTMPDYFRDGVLSYEITNHDLERVIDEGHGIVGAFTGGCPITAVRPMDKIRTIAGMAVVAAEGELYYNVHTTTQTFYGDIRGQLHPKNEWPQLGATAAER